MPRRVHDGPFLPRACVTEPNPFAGRRPTAWRAGPGHALLVLDDGNAIRAHVGLAEGVEMGLQAFGAQGPQVVFLDRLAVDDEEENGAAGAQAERRDASYV
ncbi:MAG: hypothetical protein QOE90_1377 [Thermoplasmata archaeon]|nr:hypothetical protein [Thermoplasmata archaeon]